MEVIVSIIDFESEKDRRTDAEMAWDQEHWENVSHYLAEIMCISRLHQTSMVSAALSAIIEALGTDAHNLSRHDAKALIGRSLKAFQE